MQTVSYHGHKVFFYTTGSGEPLVFLHGWPTNSNLWKAQIEALKTHYRVITLDWLGFGNSDKPKNFHYTFTKQKEVLDLVLAQELEAGEEVTLVAHDIGGPPTLLWASENEDRVKRLILLNTVVYPFKTQMDALSEFLMGIPVIKNVLVSDFGLQSILKSYTKSGDPELPAKIEALVAAYYGVEKAVRLKTILEPMEGGRKNELLTLAQKYQTLAADKFLIIAKDDPLCYKHIEQLHQDNPEVPVFYLDKCGHFIPIDQPRALNEILFQILKAETGS